MKTKSESGPKCDSPERADPAMLRELLGAHYDWILRMCVYEIKGRDSALECAQEIMVECIKSLPRFNARSQFKTWLYVIAKRRIWRFKGRLQKAARKVTTASAKSNLSGAQNSAEIHLTEGSTDFSAEQALVRSEIHKELLEAVNGLPDRQRSAVTLHYFEEMSYEETALLMGCTVGSVKKHLFRARRALGEQLSSIPSRDESGEGEPDDFTSIDQTGFNE